MNGQYSIRAALNKEPPLPGPLLHKFVEERELRGAGWIRARLSWTSGDRLNAVDDMD
jgi:hypothetical protein